MKRYVHPKNWWYAVEDNEWHFWIHAYENCMVDFTVKEEDLKLLWFIEEADVFDECVEAFCNWHIFIPIYTTDENRTIEVRLWDHVNKDNVKAILKEHFQHYVDAYNGEKLSQNTAKDNRCEPDVVSGAIWYKDGWNVCKYCHNAREKDEEPPSCDKKD